LVELHAPHVAYLLLVGSGGGVGKGPGTEATAADPPGPKMILASPRKSL